MQSIEQIKERDRIMNEFHEFLKTDVALCEVIRFSACLPDSDWGETILQWCGEIIDSAEGLDNGKEEAKSSR